jgi:hypothetical protein
MGTFLLLSRDEVLSNDLVSLFSAWFDRVILPPRSILPRSELAAVLVRDDCAEFCVGGTVDIEASAIVLVRGDLTVMSVPLSDFTASGDGTVPDFRDFAVTDHGRTLRFGPYESAFDAVLYPHDPQFRRRFRARKAATDRSLGGSIRRLRLQRKLRLEDLGALAKTTARIERGEVTRPHRATSDALARLLRVETTELGQF